VPKNVVICCDGTGNEFSDTNSNVVKLYSTLVIDASQAGYYHPGVGTMGAPTARGWFEKQWTKATGLAFGAGLLSNVGDAYRYLMNTYNDGDSVFLFGFSRGAYTVRALAGMLHMYGLLHAGNDSLIPYITRMFAECHTRESAMADTFEVAHNFKWTYSRDCQVHFAGLWDTVSSVGWITDPLVLPYSARNPILHTVRHAISTEERRCYFQSNRFGAPYPHQDIQQVWFYGVHSDVGGSYPEKESGLSKVALEWMLVEAKTAGLHIDPVKANIVLGRHRKPNSWMPDYVEPNPSAAQHESLRGAWWIAEYLPHRYVDTSGGKPRVRWEIPRGQWWRPIPEGSLICESVFEGQPGVNPKRLPETYTRVSTVTYPPA